MSKLNVHFFVGDFRGGGAERAVVEIANHIDRDKIALTLIVLKREGTYLQELASDIPVIEFLDRKPLSGKLYIFWRLIQHISNTKPRVIVGFTTPIARFMLLAKLFCFTKTRYIAVEQNNVSSNIMQYYHPGLNLLMQWFTKVLYKSADYLVTVSKGIEKKLINDYKLDSKKCQTIYNPVDIARVREIAGQTTEIKDELIDDKNLIIAIGRLVPQKGYDDMIEVMYLVNQEVPCKLLILGEGPLRKNLENKIESLSLTDRILMPGFVKKPWSYLSVSTLFLSTSHWEGFSLAHIEAMACGIPLILTDCDFGPKELIVPEKNGILVPVGSIQQIADRVKELLLSNNLRNSLIYNANQYINQFDSSIIAGQYEKAIKKLLIAVLFVYLHGSILIY